MAVYLPRAYLIPRIHNEINTHLRLTLKPKYNPNNKRKPPPEIVEFFKCDDNGVHLPMFFAHRLIESIQPAEAETIRANYAKQVQATQIQTTQQWTQVTQTQQTQAAQIQQWAQVAIKFTGTLRPSQVDVIHQSIQHINQYRTTTLGLYPGFGKTILGAALSCHAGLLTCVLVHREILTAQWRKTFLEFTDAVSWIVGEPNPPSNCSVIICMDTRWEQIPLSMRRQVGTLIIDEAHRFCTRGHVRCLLEGYQPKIVLVETATLERQDEMERMMYHIAGTHGIFIENGKKFTVHRIFTGVNPPTKYRGQTPIYDQLLKDTLADARRNQMILQLIQANKQYKILVLTALVDHAHHLGRMVAQAGISVDVMCGNKKVYVDSNVLIGTMSKLGEGFDPITAGTGGDGRDFDLVIIASSIKNHTAIVQNIGRGLRAANPVFFDLQDEHYIFLNHGKLRMNWYEKRKATIHTYNQPCSQDAVVDQWLQDKLRQLEVG